MWEVSSRMHFEPTSLIKTFLSLYFPFAEIFTALVIIFLFLFITISKMVKSHRFIKINPPPGDSHALKAAPLFSLLRHRFTSLGKIPSSLRPVWLSSDMLNPPTDVRDGMAVVPAAWPWAFWGLWCVGVHKTGDQNYPHTSDVLGSAAQRETRYDFARSLKIILLLIEAKVMLDWIALESWT